jgi:hypothetical protein
MCSPSHFRDQRTQPAYGCWTCQDLQRTKDQRRFLSSRTRSDEANGTIDLEGECQHARAVAVFTAPHEDRAAAHLCGALNSLQRYIRATRAGRDRCIPHCVRDRICSRKLNMAETMAADVSLRTSGRSVPVASLLLIMAVMRTAATRARHAQRSYSTRMRSSISGA